MSLSGLVQVWDLELGSGFKMRPIYNSAAVLCVLDLFFIICKGGSQNKGARAKLSERGSYILHMLCRNFVG